MSIVGFIGLGRLGSPFAKLLAEAGHDVKVCSRGRSDEAVSNGAEVAGDGSPQAVAEAAGVILTCLPSSQALAAVVDGVLAAGRPLKIVELSTLAIPDKEAQRDRVAAAGGELLDCPVSGTPVSAANKEAVIFVSGDKPTYDAVVELLQALTPKQMFLGPFGNATKMKYVANFLAFTHVTAAAEAMAFAGAVGLDQSLVAQLISKSEPATSGQFNIRAPLMAEGNFESKLVTVDMMRKDLDLITEHAAAVGASAELLAVVKGFYDRMASDGEGGSDPAKLSAVLLDQAKSAA